MRPGIATWPQADPQPPGRDQRSQHERCDAYRSAHRQRQLGCHREAGQRRVHVRRAERHERHVRDDDDHARDDRGQRRRREPAVRLQNSIEHDCEAVEQDLWREHGKHVSRHGHQRRLRAVRSAVRRAEQARQRARRQRDREAHWHQDDRRPGQQGRRRLADRSRRGRVCSRPVRGPGRDRHHDAGQRAAEGDVVDDVRQCVGGDILIPGRWRPPSWRTRWYGPGRAAWQGW